MGCYPLLGKIVSKVLGKCNGRGDDERWREERMNYAMAYPPGPPTETHYMRPVATSVHMVPPSPPPQQPPPQGPTPAQAEPQAQPRAQTPPAQPEPTPAPEQAAQQAPPEQPRQQPKRGKKKPPRRVRFGPEQPPPPQQQQEQHQQQEEQQQPPEHAPAPEQQQQGQGQRHQGYGGAAGPQGHLFPFRYTPSPLPRWEATPRRHEYFSGEYRSYYPTPVREGIYRIATDANRLTTIFSEENPNACTIV